MRVTTGIFITCLWAGFFATLAGSAVQGQTPAPSQAGVSSQDATDELVVAVGKSVLVDSARQIERIAVGSGDLAEATAVSPTEVMINGKAPGETTLILWQTGGGRQFFNVKILPGNSAVNDRVEALRREFKNGVPRTDIAGQL